MSATPLTTVRLDKWLWAARFYKTRSAATEAVQGGKVSVNEQAAKPARMVGVGDAITIRIAPFTWQVEVTGLAERRGSAELASTLYSESARSRTLRERHAEQLRDAPMPRFDAGKPTKRDRRELEKWRRREK